MRLKGGLAKRRGGGEKQTEGGQRGERNKEKGEGTTVPGTLDNMDLALMIM